MKTIIKECQKLAKAKMRLHGAGGVARGWWTQGWGSFSSCGSSEAGACCPWTQHSQTKPCSVLTQIHTASYYKLIIKIFSIMKPLRCDIVGKLLSGTSFTFLSIPLTNPFLSWTKKLTTEFTESYHHLGKSFSK